MKPTPFRPEDRRRAVPNAVPWADTVPQCFRSEGFAEDLLHVEPTERLVPAARWQVGLPMWSLPLASALGLARR